MSDPYAVLGVSKSASADEIRGAYRGRMRAVHPDTKHGDEEAAKEVNAAYALLSDPERRRRYDMAQDAATVRRTERLDDVASCPYCGIDLSRVVSVQHHIAEHLRRQFGGCAVCDRLPTSEVLYRSVAGLWLFWSRHRFSARVCKHCSTGVFREFQARTLAFGWWSFVGFFLTPYYLVQNLSQLRRTEALKTPEPNDLLIETTLKGRPVLLRPRVLVILGVVLLWAIFAAISESRSSTPEGISATAAAGSAAGTATGINADSPQAAIWAVDSCVAIQPASGRVRPIACASSLAAGIVVSIETHIDRCTLPADLGVEFGTGRFACVDDWSYEFDELWHVGACVTFKDDFVDLVDCSSGRVDGHVVATTSSQNRCPAHTESYINYDADNVVCLSHTR